MTRSELLALLLELADLIRDALASSPTIRLMMPARVRAIVLELERHATNTSRD